MPETDEDMERLFLNTKPAELLIHLKDEDERNYASALSTDANVTYSHTVKCLQRMQKCGIVQFERKGRKKKIKLTTQGEDIAKNLFDLIDTLTGDPKTEDSVIEDRSW